MAKTKINFQAVQETQTPQKEPKKRGRFFSLLVAVRNRPKKKNKDETSRGITFASRPWQNKLTLFFYLFLSLLIIVLLATFTRVGTIARIALKKDIDEVQLVQNVNQELNNQDVMKYQVYAFIRTLIDYDKEDAAIEAREKALTPFLAKGLSINELGFSQASEGRQLISSTFIAQEPIKQAKNQYYVNYDISYTEANQPVRLTIAVPVSFEESQMKVIGTPVITNLLENTTKNEASVNKDLHTISGDKLPEELDTNVSKFLSTFFELYVKNDEKLALISAVEGLNGAELDQYTVTNSVIDNDSNILCTGTIQFHYGEASRLSTPFTIKLKKTNDTFYVLSVN